MNDETRNQDIVEDSRESNELEPVKGSFKRMLSVGTKVVIGGTVIAFVVSPIRAPRCLGVTRSARLEYERRTTEIEKAMAEVEQESGNVVNE
ncbi:MAG: hypothetical protein ACYSWQ_25205 [Planctomycetota bacterium]|jgi:hypothetical protein